MLRTPDPTRFTLLAALVAAGSLGACRALAHGRHDAGDAVIGIAYNPQRAGMHEIARGAALAAEALTRDSAARALGIRFVTHEPPRTVTSAVEIAQRLRDDPDVVGIVGDAESGRTLDEIPVLEDLEHAGARAVVAVSPTATSTSLTGRSPWIFRVTPTDAAVSQATAAYLSDSLGARRAAVVYRNDSYGRDWTAAFVSAFRARGGAVVQRDPYVTGITEWDAIAAYTARTGADAILFPGSAEDAAEFLSALRRAGVRVPFVGGDAVASLAEQTEFAGARYATPYSADHAPRTAAAAAFVAAYTARWHEPPTARAALAYDAALVIGRATLAVGRDRLRIRDWVAGVGSATPAIPGATGAIAFDRSHDARDRSVAIVTVAGSAPAVATATEGAR
ncbi:putative branched-chain amino acid-binding protein [Gemmatirosa kalamazoonensis]|uniref:Putative branched-chain amino acid-binding protein n=1 Tax=Gemmatirosa kalamazoonensis TaxID=861299 RepID=W0RKI2_9BACT|nr:ABC transporter substrate-binding protein [Gemmatirosa kalamazoonensis]AHG89943.1 putative branched-chain amino acid-binding protein [Gemmatirosa kalamazoonensis]